MLNLTLTDEAEPRLMRSLTEAAHSLVHDIHRQLSWKDYANCALSPKAVEVLTTESEAALIRIHIKVGPHLLLG